MDHATLGPWARLRRWAFARTERMVARASLVGDHKFYDPARFDWIPHIEANYHLMQAELQTLLEKPRELPNLHEIVPDQEGLTNDNLWKSFFFYFYGHRIRENCERCPETDRLLRTIPGMKTGFFSIMLPGKELPMHRGPYNGVLRYHLGLRIPQPHTSCGIMVGGEKAHWTEGRSLVFDDTYLHRAWNLSRDIRVVLFVDFRRPLRFPQSVFNSCYIAYISLTPFATAMVARQKDKLRSLEHAYQKHG
jgi:ornithine lipid ester-linked acyl 2-hydroxylase